MLGISAKYHYWKTPVYMANTSGVMPPLRAEARIWKPTNRLHLCGYRNACGWRGRVGTPNELDVLYIYNVSGNNDYLLRRE